MNRRSILWAMTAFGLASLPGDALAQQKSLKEQLIGTWTFVSAVETSKDGTKSDRWGPNPKGLIIFDANGRYSFMISRSDIPKFAANNVKPRYGGGKQVRRARNNCQYRDMVG